MLTWAYVGALGHPKLTAGTCLWCCLLMLLIQLPHLTTTTTTSNTTLPTISSDAHTRKRCVQARPARVVRLLRRQTAPHSEAMRPLQNKMVKEYVYARALSFTFASQAVFITYQYYQLHMYFLLMRAFQHISS